MFRIIKHQMLVFREQSKFSRVYILNRIINLELFSDHWFETVQMWNCSNVKLFQVKLFQCETGPKWNWSKVKLFQCVPMWNCTNVKLCKCETFNVKLFQCETVQMWNCCCNVFSSCSNLCLQYILSLNFIFKLCLFGVLYEGSRFNLVVELLYESKEWLLYL